MGAWLLAFALGATPMPDAAEAREARFEAAQERYFGQLEARLASSPRARDLLLASNLRRLRAHAAERRSDGVAAQRLEAASDALLQRALARDGQDPLLWWSALRPCRASLAACGGADPLDRLRALTPHNGVVWVRPRSLAAGSPAELRAEQEQRLERIARASRFDTQLGEHLRAWWDAFERFPPPAALLRELPGDLERLPPALTTAHLGFNLALMDVGAEVGGYSELCGDQALAAGGDARAHRCRAALDRALAKADNLLSYYAAWRPRRALEGEPARRAELERARDAVEWRAAAVDELFEELETERGRAAFAASIALWRRAGAHELSVHRALLQERGVALSPPPAWRSLRTIEVAPAAQPK